MSNLRSPGFWNVDSSLAKDFHISEEKYFEFRWEVFNIQERCLRQPACRRKART
ncbi:MAG: hypothetical protein LAP13_06080 [Acidobacteriia bacterium]|nr:hypothetical protein [Terriglobia bacterium]